MGAPALRRVASASFWRAFMASAALAWPEAIDVSAMMTRSPIGGN
jgi:hypothetical protein